MVFHNSEIYVKNFHLFIMMETNKTFVLDGRMDRDGEKSSKFGY